MKIERLGTSEKAGTEKTHITPGIYEVKEEEEVVRTYSNGLSFKHVPGDARWNYKKAVAARLRAMGLESAEQCRTHAPAVIEMCDRWKALEKRFYEENGHETGESTRALHELAEFTGLSPVGLENEELMKEVRKRVHDSAPKFLAANLASSCGDRSNLGQSSFLRLVAAGRGYLESIDKLQWVKTFFEEEPHEFLSFLLFGRAPWTEQKCSWQFHVPFFWARNFLVGTHNKFMVHLERERVTLPKPCMLPHAEFRAVMEEFEAELEQDIAEMEEKGAQTTRITGFLNSLRAIKNDPDILDVLFAEEKSPLIWKQLKAYANSLKGISFSALRSALIRVCLNQDTFRRAMERCIRLFVPCNALKKPFHELVSLTPLPIDLIMGRKYVIYRPGNAKKMGELLTREGCLWFEIPKVFLNGTRKKARAYWYAPKRVLEALQQGARAFNPFA